MFYSYRCSYRVTRLVVDQRESRKGVEWVAPDGTARGTITFITPEAYPHCLWPGKALPILEGSRVVGQATVIAVLNPLLLAEHP